MTLYSANNTPYSAMTGVMTGDVNERTSLSSFRFVSAMIAQLIVAASPCRWSPSSATAITPRAGR
jgi:Na+/melibiose symporter-like transporter